MKKFVKFIAGAVCPNCKSIDTIAINADDDEICCVKCDFIENRPKEEKIKNDKGISVINLDDYKKKHDKN
tara:strand:+ start:10965 stop:11174 length:210 start_codon:yes stop_codon:yes gene_type:complete